MKILLVYPGTRYSTYDVARGWETALKELGHEVIDFPSHDWVQFFILAFAAWKADTEQRIGIKNSKEYDAIGAVMASEQLIPRTMATEPDAMLFVTGNLIPPHVYKMIDKLNVPRVVILTESPYDDDVQLEILRMGRFDAAFTNDKISVRLLRERAGIPVEYLPHSFCPTRHGPGEPDEDYWTDAYFHGTMFPERRRLFERYLGRRYGGNGNYDKWGVFISPHLPGADENQILTNEELVLYYQATSIGLNHHRTSNGTWEGPESHINYGGAWSIGPRAYEIAACGAFQLCDDARPELREVFGDSVATYKMDDADDLEDKLDYYLTHDDEREAMAETAYERVQGCRFIDRARNILLPVLETI